MSNRIQVPGPPVQVPQQVIFALPDVQMVALMAAQMEKESSAVEAVERSMEILAEAVTQMPDLLPKVRAAKRRREMLSEIESKTPGPVLDEISAIEVQPHAEA